MPTLPSDRRRRYIPEKEKKPAGSNQGFYNSTRWRKVSKAHKRNFPLCEVCAANDELKSVDVTDHIVPIEKGGSKFNPLNFMSMCHEHHNAKRGLESHGYCVQTEMDFNNEFIPVDRDEIIVKLCQ